MKENNLENDGQVDQNKEVNKMTQSQSVDNLSQSTKKEINKGKNVDINIQNANVTDNTKNQIKESQNTPITQFIHHKKAIDTNNQTSYNTIDKNSSTLEKTGPRRIFTRNSNNTFYNNRFKSKDFSSLEYKKKLTVPNYKSSERSFSANQYSRNQFSQNTKTEEKKGTELTTFKSLQNTKFSNRLEFKLDVEELVDTGAQFGHKRMFTNPVMKPYIFCNQGDTAIIDLDQTKKMLKDACEYLEHQSAYGKRILFIGTKDRIKELIAKYAGECGAMYINNRWAPGTLTNFYTLYNSLKNVDFLERKINNPKVKMVKKEKLKIQRRCSKINLYLSGLKNMKSLPQILVIVDVQKENIAIKEAKKLNIPVIGIVDSNGDPRIDYPIPCNDDSVQSVNLVLSKITEFISSGVKFFAKNNRLDPDRNKFGNRSFDNKSFYNKRNNNDQSKFDNNRSNFSNNRPHFSNNRPNFSNNRPNFGDKLNHDRFKFENKPYKPNVYNKSTSNTVNKDTNNENDTTNNTSNTTNNTSNTTNNTSNTK